MDRSASVGYTYIAMKGDVVESLVISWFLLGIFTSES
jgi:hypothetical protein